MHGFDLPKRLASLQTDDSVDFGLSWNEGAHKDRTLNKVAFRAFWKDVGKTELDVSSRIHLLKGQSICILFPDIQGSVACGGKGCAAGGGHSRIIPTESDVRFGKVCNQLGRVVEFSFDKGRFDVPDGLLESA